jgi:hypothetical protein
MIQDLFFALGCSFFAIKILEVFVVTFSKPKSFSSELLSLMALTMPLIMKKDIGERIKREEIENK